MSQSFFWIDPQALRFLHEASLAEFGGASGIRDITLFESALARPQNIFAYNSNADIATLAAAYGYGLAKNHAFIDGNKRVAFASVGVFLGINGYRLKTNDIDAIRVMLSVDSGDISEEEFAGWIRSSIIKR
jgi:death-on-curing protein